MVSGQISDAQISASSYADRGWVAENARLLTGRSGWTGQQTKQPFRNEWLQVGLTLSFESLMMGDSGVIGLLQQQCAVQSFINKSVNQSFSLSVKSNQPFSSLSRPPLQVDLGQDKMVSGVVIQGGKHRDRNVFMKRFRVGHSLDGEDWTIVKEDNTTKPKVGLT